MTSNQSRISQYKKPLAVVTFVAVFLVILLGAVIALFVRQVFTRIHLDPQALSIATRQAVNETLAQGEVEQKLQTIAALEKMGAVAKPFLPALFVASRESEPKISAAALRAISAIDATNPN